MPLCIPAVDPLLALLEDDPETDVEIQVSGSIVYEEAYSGEVILNFFTASFNETSDAVTERFDYPFRPLS